MSGTEKSSTFIHHNKHTYRSLVLHPLQFDTFQSLDDKNMWGWECDGACTLSSSLMWWSVRLWSFPEAVLHTEADTRWSPASCLIGSNQTAHIQSLHVGRSHPWPRFRGWATLTGGTWAESTRLHPPPSLPLSASCYKISCTVFAKCWSERILQACSAPL